MTIHLRDILHEGGHSLVVENDGNIRTFDGRGVSDLFRLVTEEREILRGASIADKVVGKGAAALMIVGGVKSLYADVISTPAIDLFGTTSVKVDYGCLVNNIINRKADGICPVESLCLPVESARDCLPLISKFLSSKHIQKK